jgi:hypothetical protein
MGGTMLLKSIRKTNAKAPGPHSAKHLETIPEEPCSQNDSLPAASVLLVAAQIKEQEDLGNDFVPYCLI